MLSRGIHSLLVAFVVILGLVSVGLVVRQVHANIGPTDNADDGLVLSSCEDVQMPSANVSIRVFISDSFEYDISTNCSFELFAESAANCSIAFVFPEAWLHDSEADTLSQDIYIDGVKIDAYVMEWEDLSPDLQPTDFYTILEHCSYAVFNTTFSQNQTRIVDVDTNLEFVSHAQAFMFRYAVGSGKYWTGQTNETVTIEVDDQAGLESLSFSPTPNLIENVSATVKTATWQIQVDQFLDFWVTLFAQQGEYRPIEDPWGVLLGTIVLVMIVFVIACPRRRVPSESSGPLPMDKKL